MNQLHSLAYSSSLYNWDYHSLGLLNSDKMSLVMEGSCATSFSPQDSDFSTGYLEDALIEFGERSKRRRLLPYTDHDHDHEQITKSFNIDDIDKNFWNLNPTWHGEPAENLYCMDHIERICADEHISPFRSKMREEPSILVADSTKSPEMAISPSESPNSSSSSYKELPLVTSKTSRHTSPGNSEEEMEKKKVIKRVVYPFALVKPGGIREGEVTLNDINERILMRPTRPVRHPVGDFACRPCVSTGLSGKAVVALTRIHTLGRRGTITIIRTKA